MRNDEAEKCYRCAIAIDSRYEPAQQNIRRIFKLFHFGASNGTVYLGE
jgi:virulence-associated protein VapD